MVCIYLYCDIGNMNYYLVDAWSLEREKITTKERVDIRNKLMNFDKNNDDNFVYVICGARLKCYNNVGLNSLIDLLKFSMRGKNVLICIVRYDDFEIITSISKVTDEFISTIENYLTNYYGIIDVRYKYNINDLKNEILDCSGRFSHLATYKLKIYFIL